MAENHPPPKSTSERINESIGLAETIAKRRLDLIKLDAAEKAAKSGGGLVAGIIVLLLASVRMLTFNLALGFLLAEQTSLSAGESFFCLTLFYLLLIGLIIWQRHRFFTNAILAIIIKKLF